MSQQMRNGYGFDFPVPAGQSMLVSSITGTYTATIVAGPGKGTALATDSTGGGTYGPYSGGVVIRLQAGANSLIDYDIAVSPVLTYAGPLNAGYNSAGDASSAVDGAGKIALRPKAKQPVGVLRKFSEASSSGAATITRAAVFQLPFRVRAAKLRVYNALVGTYPNFTAAIASSADASGGVLTAVADNAVFQFSGAPTVTVPAGSGTIPNHTLGYVDSDVLNFSSVPDARGYGSTIHLRTYQPTASNTRFIRPSGAGNPSIAQHGVVCGYQTGVDGVTTWSALNTPIATDSSGPVELICYTDSQVKQILVTGGSTSNGYGDTTGFGWADRAANSLTTSTSAVLVIGYGETGSTTAASLARLLAFVDVEPVRAVAWFPFSTNDTDTATDAGLTRIQGQLVRFVAEMAKRDISPVLITQQAPTGYAGASNTNRKLVNQMCRDMAAAGYASLLDIAGIVSDETQATGTWKIPAQTDDGTHPNAAGHEAIAPTAALLFSSLLLN